MKTFNRANAKYPAYLQNLRGAWVPSIGIQGSRVFDLSGFNNHGVFQNMDTATDWASGPEGPVVDFDGSNDNLLLSSSPIGSKLDMGLVTGATWFARFKIRVSGQQGIMSNWEWSAGTSQTYLLFINSTTEFAFVFRSFQGSNYAVATGAACPTDIWHNFAAVVDGTNIKLYVNGVQSGATAPSNGWDVEPGGPGPVVLGADSSGTSRMNGQIAAVYMWDRPLALTEIQQLNINPYAPVEEREHFSLKKPLASFKPFWAKSINRFLG